jgi:hypothetical protein
MSSSKKQKISEGDEKEADDASETEIPNKKHKPGSVSAVSKEKETPVGSVGSDEEEEDHVKLQARREANRMHAFKSRQRSKMLLTELQQTVSKLNREKGELERQNAVLTAQVEVLQQQNMALLQNQQQMLLKQQVVQPPPLPQSTDANLQQQQQLQQQQPMMNALQNPANSLLLNPMMMQVMMQVALAQQQQQQQQQQMQQPPQQQQQPQQMQVPQQPQSPMFDPSAALAAVLSQQASGVLSLANTGGGDPSPASSTLQSLLRAQLQKDLPDTANDDGCNDDPNRSSDGNNMSAV